MSRFPGFLPGMIVGMGLFTVVFIVYVKIEKDAVDAKVAVPAPVLNGAGRVDGAGRAEAIAAPPNLPRPAPPDFPRPAPPLPWPAYDSGPLHPGEHLYELLTADDKGIYSRSIDVLPKLLHSDDIPPPPSDDVPPPPSPNHK